MRTNWYIRRLQKIRHGSYVISVPPEWISKEGLKPHNELYIVTNDGCLYIYVPYDVDNINIDVTNLDTSIIKYLILSYYMQGASEIHITSQKPLGAETKRLVKETIKKLRNADITDMGLNYIILRFKDETPYISIKDFLNEIENMFRFINNAVSDLVLAVINSDKMVVEEVIERIDDFDKNYRYIIRIVSKMAQFPQYNVFPSPRELIAYAALAKDLARSVYHLSKVANFYLHGANINGDALMATKRLYDELYKFYKLHNLETVATIKHTYEYIKRLLQEPNNKAEYELRRLAAYSIAIMDDILNIYCVPPKKKKAVTENIHAE